MSDNNKRYGILRQLVYEATQPTPSDLDGANQQSNGYSPIDVHPNFERGKYYLYVNIRDKSLFDSASNFTSDIINSKNTGRKKNGKSLMTPEEESYWRGVFWIGTDNKRLDKDTNEVSIRVRIEDPLTLYTESGELNANSGDFKRIRSMMNWVKKRLGAIPEEVVGEEMGRAVNSIYYSVKNVISNEGKKDLDDKADYMFFEMCNNLGKPETMELLRKISIGDESYLIDHRFSLLNKLRFIKQAQQYDEQDANANQLNSLKYLATERQWAIMGRKVTNYDHPYHGVTYNGNSVSIPKAISYLNSRGVRVLQSNGKMSPQQRRAVITQVNNILNGKGKFTYNSPYYNVTDTEPISGAVDSYNDEVGASNNLSGEANAVATQQMGVKTDGNDERQERINTLNQSFGTQNYGIVDSTYQAICDVAHQYGVLIAGNFNNANMNSNDKLRESTDLISKMVKAKLNSFKGGGGRLAKEENFVPLINIGTVFVMAMIKLPMDFAPRIEGYGNIERYKTNALSSIVDDITTDIARQRSVIKKVDNIDMKSSANDTINEMLSIYSQLFVFEDVFNKYFNIINDYAQK